MGKVIPLRMRNKRKRNKIVENYAAMVKRNTKTREHRPGCHCVLCEMLPPETPEAA